MPVNAAPLPRLHISACSVAHTNLLDVAQLALATSLHAALAPPHQHTPHIPVTMMLLLLLSHFSRVRLCATPSLGFSRQEHWSGLPFPSPMHKSEK